MKEYSKFYLTMEHKYPLHLLNQKFQVSHMEIEGIISSENVIFYFIQAYYWSERERIFI
jgi:hypothetical protein